MILLDGADGEGGGQILRTAVALSMVTAQPFRIGNIRANRNKPGLMRQHLTAVRAGGVISNAHVTGAEIGSGSLVFEPGPVTGGCYEFAVGTAGSATLVLQTVLPALMVAEAPSQVTLEGGTHNPHAPPFEFIDRAFCSVLRRMGVDIELQLHRPGFYPAGGGRFVVDLGPPDRLVPIDLVERGELRAKQAEAVVANLPIEIAQREVKVIGERLGWSGDELSIRQEERTHGPGNILLLTLGFDHVTEVCAGFGQPGVSAEAVANRTAQSVRRFLRSNAAVGHRLADQLVLPMALAGRGSFTTEKPTPHLLTNIYVIKKFIDVEVTVQEIESRRWQVTIGG